jgi:S-adenosylmethionine synthetase
MSDVNKDIQEIAKAKAKTLGYDESLIGFNISSAEKFE